MGVIHRYPGWHSSYGKLITKDGRNVNDFHLTFPVTTSTSPNTNFITPTEASYAGSELWNTVPGADLKKDTTTWDALKNSFTIYSSDEKNNPIYGGVESVVDVTPGIVKLRLDAAVISAAGVADNDQIIISYSSPADLLETQTGIDVAGFDLTFNFDIANGGLLGSPNGAVPTFGAATFDAAVVKSE